MTVYNNAINLSASTATGQIAQSNVSTGIPSWSTATYPATAGTNGNVLTSNGTNWVSTPPGQASAFVSNDWVSYTYFGGV